MSAIRVNSPVALTTPEQIARFQLMAVRTMIKMEKIGLRHSSGPVRPKWAAKLGLKPRDSYDKFIDALTERIES